MNKLSCEQQTVLALLRASLWNSRESFSPEADWQVIETIAKEQAVIPLVYNGTVTAKLNIPSELSDKWKKRTMYGVMKNERLMCAQEQIITQLTQNGIPCVVLKGSSVSRYYPAPDLRVLGDVDVLISKENIEKATDILQQLGYVLHGADHDFHLGFSRKDAYVEVHYDVTSLPDNLAGQLTRLETAHFLESTDSAALTSHTFPVLTETNQALSLLLHMVRHMYETGIGLRQMCDWAMFLASPDSDVFAQSTLPVLSRCGLLQYANAATAVCISYLGLPHSHAAWCKIDEDICSAFLESVFCGGNMGRADKNGMSTLFTDSKSIGTNHSSGKAVISNLNALCHKNFPSASRFLILRPFLWIYLVIRYAIRSLFGKRKKVSVGKIINNAKKHRNLHEQLNPFGIDGENPTQSPK